MSNLAVAVNASTPEWTLTANLAAGTRFLKVGSEVVEVIAFFPTSVYVPTGEITPPSVRVERAVGSTSAASHAQGAAITEYADESAFTGSGGASTAADVSFTPNGSIAATDVQAAIQEVRDEAGAGLLQSLTVTLQPADILVLNESPFELVPAQGPNTIIDVQHIFARSIFGTAPYSHPDGLSVQVGSVDVASLASELLTHDDDRFASAPGASGGGFLANAVNEPLILDAGEDTDGGSIVDSELAAGGIGWIVGDTFGVSDGSATGEVDTVDADPTFAITDVNQGASTFTIAGDHEAEFPDLMLFRVIGSTGNDTVLWVVISAVFDTDHTTIQVQSAPDPTVDGSIHLGGAVTAYTITDPGADHDVEAGVSTNATDPINMGTGLTIDITEILQGDGTLIITTEFIVRDVA